MALGSLFGMESENLDNFFVKEVEQMTSEQRARLPNDILVKLFKNDGKLKLTALEKLGFAGRMYILSKCLKKRWYVIIEDEERGSGLYEFPELQKASKKRQIGVEQSKALTSTGSFVLGNKELMDAMGYLNSVSSSPSYNYLSKAKNLSKNKAAKWSDEMRYIAKFLTFWEGRKKTWVAEMNIAVPEMLVLLYTYYMGKEVPGADMYKGIFKRAFQSSINKIKGAFKTLQGKGYLIKKGSTSDAMMQITPLGIEIVNQILIKYAVNC